MILVMMNSDLMLRVKLMLIYNLLCFSRFSIIRLMVSVGSMLFKGMGSRMMIDSRK